MTAKRTKRRETHEREACDRWNTQSRRCNKKGHNRNHGKARKAGCRYPRRLQRTSEGCLVDPKLITHVCAEPIVRAELLGDFQREFLREASVDPQALALRARCRPAPRRAVS
jgi:hypothetical protein